MYVLIEMQYIPSIVKVNKNLVFKQQCPLGCLSIKPIKNVGVKLWWLGGWESHIKQRRLTNNKLNKSLPHLPSQKEMDIGVIVINFTFSWYF